MENKILTNFEDLYVGQTGEFTHVVTSENVEDFIALTGDSNPIHHDKVLASNTVFGKPVVHGMLTASLISTLIGTVLPGPGSLWLSQTLDFVNPVFVGETLSINGTIKQKSLGLRVVVIETTVLAGENVKIRGEAKVKILD